MVIGHYYQQVSYVWSDNVQVELVSALSLLITSTPLIQLTTSDNQLDNNAIQASNLNVDDKSTSVHATNKVENELRRVQIYISILVIMVSIIMALLYYLRRLRSSEAKARQSQSLLESIIEHSYQYIAILDPYGRVISSNNKFHELLFEQGLNIDKPIWHFNGWEEGGSKVLSQFFASTEEKASNRFEIEVTSKKSGTILLEVVLNKLPEESGIGSQYLFEANDITVGKLAQQKLIERESTMRTYYEQQPVMMMTLDGNNRIQALNQFAEQLLGYKEIEILGHRLRGFYADEETLPAKQLLLTNESSMNGVWRREIRYKNREGAILWIRENIRPLDRFGKLLVVGEDITEIHILTEQLEYQARYDLLTETFNRNHFEIELEKSLKEVSEQLRTHAMLYLDLDQLKVLNDTAGHDAGDAAIKFAAMVVESILPYNAILSRMGGDEFAVLSRDCTEIDACNIADAIITELSRNTFQWGDISLNITCSIGIRLIDYTADSPQMVHAQADTACHAAKDEGRNRYHLYHQDDEELRRRQLEMESVNLVHEALANNRLELFAQTILALEETNHAEKMHFEILVRIKSAAGEYISPGIFMPASEKYNVAHLIDKQVVVKTLSWLESNLVDFDSLGLCSINLSGQSIGNKDFVRFLLQSIENCNVPSHKICIEITETAAMGNMERAIALFTEIKKRGCLIALDDFGSGLSSFAYLKKLPVDIVKIDGLFVRDMDRNETDYIMVRSIHDLAKQMGKKTVAEFVENTDIIDRLIELGVDYGQGYIISKPKPLAELVAEAKHTQ
ncbi:EAL domain-containing protein [Vibrio sp. MA40-2]|uniref:sensor domain-containing protein n=1 Tax=Vibrio sp. MA40-2 TaxID=3391828 RepID=UPI0039A50154